MFRVKINRSIHCIKSILWEPKFKITKEHQELVTKLPPHIDHNWTKAEEEFLKNYNNTFGAYFQGNNKLYINDMRHVYYNTLVRSSGGLFGVIYSIFNEPSFNYQNYIYMGILSGIIGMVYSLGKIDFVRYNFTACGRSHYKGLKSILDKQKHNFTGDNNPMMKLYYSLKN